MPRSSRTSGAEPRERQRAPPLDDQLHDIARQDEHQRGEHREVGGRERVEDELAQEARRKRDDPFAMPISATSTPAAPRCPQDQPRVVAERPPRAHLRLRGSAGPSCTDRGNAGRHDLRHG
jgi:hypothetical protein